MSPIEVVIAPAAEREIKKLCKDQKACIFDTLEELESGHAMACKEKLQGYPDFYRVKSGKSFRIIFHPIKSDRVVILVVRHRKDAYRGLNTLNNKLETTLARLEINALQAIR